MNLKKQMVTKITVGLSPKGHTCWVFPGVTSTLSSEFLFLWNLRKKTVKGITNHRTFIFMITETPFECFGMNSYSYNQLSVSSALKFNRCATLTIYFAFYILVWKFVTADMHMVQGGGEGGELFLFWAIMKLFVLEYHM